MYPAGEAVAVQVWRGPDARPRPPDSTHARPPLYTRLTRSAEYGVEQYVERASRGHHARGRRARLASHATSKSKVRYGRVSHLS